MAEYSLQHKRKWNVVSFSKPHLRIGSTVSLKPCLNLCSFKWLKFKLRRVSSLRPLVSCICKNGVPFGSNKTEDYFFKFINWYSVSNFFTKCKPFLNRVWIKRQIKDFGSSRKSLHLVLTYWPCLVLSIIIMI